MARNPRNLLWLLPLLLLLSSPLWQPALKTFLRPRGSDAVPATILDEGQQAQRFVMNAIAITMSSGGHVEWDITADQAFTGDNDKEISLVGVNATYSGDRQEKTKIASDRGRYDVGASHLTLIDRVVIDKPLSRQKLLTDLLEYSSRDKTVVCPDKVELQGPDFRIKAGRMVYNLTHNAYDFSNRVRVELGR